MKNDSFIVTMDDTNTNEYNVISKLELEKYAEKAQVDPTTGSKQYPEEYFQVGKNVLNPRYDPNNLIELLDLYSYHEDCVDAVATDASGISYTLTPVENEEPNDSEKEKFISILENSSPSINIHLYRTIYDRRAIGYGTMEVIRESTSKSPITRLKHIPAHTLRRHTDEKRVLHRTPDGKEVWYVIYGKNYNEKGELCDVHADTGDWHPYNTLPPEYKANEILWTMEYAPGTNYYGRPPIIATLPSIKGDLSAVKYNTSFFDNYGMPKFAITITGDFADYDEEKYIETVNEDGELIKTLNPKYDETKTLRYRISQQIKEVIRNPHSAICITIPSGGEEGNVDLKITPLSVQTEEGHFRMYRKDVRDEVIHAHKIDPSRLGIFESGSLNGNNAKVTKQSYKYGTIAPIKAEMESMINQIAEEVGIHTWKFSIVDVDPVDYTKDIELAEFLFQRGAMTIMDLINNFGHKFGLNVENIDDYYLNARYLNNVPLEQVWNQSEQNPYLELDSILGKVEDGLRGENTNDTINETEERITSHSNKLQKK